MALKPIIRAIAHPVTIDAGKAELREQNDLDRHVREMLMQLLLTNPGERIHRPEFGCGIRRLVFSPLNESSASLAQVTVLNALERFMSSVIDTERVDVEFREETARIKIVYRLKTTGSRHILNMEVPS
jgi:uncharacterized protein